MKTALLTVFTAIYNILKGALIVSIGYCSLYAIGWPWTLLIGPPTPHGIGWVVIPCMGVITIIIGCALYALGDGCWKK